MASITTQTLECGLTVAIETIPNADSVAVNWVLPAGSAMEPETAIGTAPMLSELLLRGAGSMNSRALSDAFDRLGADRSISVRPHHMSVFSVMRGENLLEAFNLLDAVVRAPALPHDALEPVRSLCLQSIDSLVDDPAELIMLRVRERHLPPPYNRDSYGRRDVIESIGLEPLRSFWARHAVPRGSILGVAGRVDAEQFIANLESRWSDWSGAVAEPTTHREPERGTLHIEQDTAQMHLAIAFDAPPEAAPDSALERVAISVLSGSTSSRLFSEVRQKRALCYSVGASYAAGRDFGTVTAYAGTTPQRAQETLDVTVAEIQQLFSGSGATEDEFRRAVVGLKSHIVMQGESTSARAGALVSDLFRLGNARSLTDLADRIDRVTLVQLNDYLASRKLGPLTIASIGPSALVAPVL
jgi:predicted Zn-dependent peptidase